MHCHEQCKYILKEILYDQLPGDSTAVPSTGEIIPLVRNSHKSSDFVDFLKILDKKYSKDKKIKIVLDNHSAHTSKETRRYLDEHPGRFEFIFTPYLLSQSVG